MSNKKLIDDCWKLSVRSCELTAVDVPFELNGIEQLYVKIGSMIERLDEAYPEWRQFESTWDTVKLEGDIHFIRLHFKRYNEIVEWKTVSKYVPSVEK